MPLQGDHPRVCGEHVICMSTLSERMGSSPCMRGTHDHVARGEADGGIIPAYAGNTPAAPTTSAHGWDHPRVCGEHIFTPGSSCGRKGSSPRMRGTRLAVDDEVVELGIIPAYAGNTHPTRARCACPRDHPRVCGEHRIFLSHSLTLMGSSPRMRGTRQRPV